MKIITKGEAMQALNNVRRDEQERFSITGGPDQVSPALTVYFVTVWCGEDVDFQDVFFVREKGQVKVYNGTA